MWERLKQALSNYFMTEVVVEEEPELKSRNASEKTVQKQYQTNQQPQAKMAYTYPKERAFRFPMIPDESGSSKPEVSNVRPGRRQEQPQTQTSRQRKDNKQARTIQQTEKTEPLKGTAASYRPRQPQRPRPEPKEDKKPFQPTEVPSPVYGFRKRKEETEDIVTLASIQDRADWKKIAATASEINVEMQSNNQIDDSIKVKSPDGSILKRQEAVMQEETIAAPEVEPIHSDPVKETAAAVETAYHTAPAEMPESKLEQSEEAIKVMEEIVPEPEGGQKIQADTQDDVIIAAPSDLEAVPEAESQSSIKQVEGPHEMVQETALEHEFEHKLPEEEPVQEEEQVRMMITASSDLKTVSAETSSPDLELHEEQHDVRQDTVVLYEDEQKEPVEQSEWNETSFTEQAAIKEETTSNIAEEDLQIRESGNAVRKPVPFNVFMTPRDKRKNLETVKQPAPRVIEESAEQVNQEQTEQTEPSFSSPPMHLLNDPVEQTLENDAWVDQQSQLLETTLEHFNVNAHVVNAMQGPSVTRFEVQPDLGVKVSKIKSLTDDIKLNMAAKDIRMEAPIPGKNAIGIEVPNAVSKMVGLQEILDTGDFQENNSPLSVALGLNISGNPIVTDLQKMPHGLIAGATGSGKSVCINTILLSLLYKANHKQVKFLLIDPKMVELAPYNDLPHLVSPVITDTKAATAALKWAVNEMEERYVKFVGEGVRDIGRYNEKLTKQGRYADKMPYLVIVIDELADLMMVAPQDVEDAICRIAQKARAAGIHLLLATQRPSVDVITGLIKANIPTRIAFSVSSAIDSRTIIDNNGAEKLLGKGDMLFIENGARQAQRIQGAFVSDEEIERVVQHVKQTAPPEYLFQHEDLLERRESEEEEDELYREAVEFVIDHNSASASLLQRRFKIGYNRAARLIDHMEMRGVISEQKGSKPRDVLVSLAQLQAD